jgi:2-polyprenyl-3-methyl-5-hydroxy-6-metoxy-1,4-benzoquinol methylase
VRSSLTSKTACWSASRTSTPRRPRAKAGAASALPATRRCTRQPSYASSFITRPDSAPWIDTNEYWNRVHDLWRGKDVVLIAGDRKSLRAEEMTAEAASVREIKAPRQHAYAEIDRIEEEINGHNGPILMCLGCTATALAARLHRKGLWGIDLGHIGMFMRHAGIYNMIWIPLCSSKYRRSFGPSTSSRNGDSAATGTLATCSEPHLSHSRDQRDGPPDLEKVTVLDYGCGEGALKKALAPHRVQEYDPGIRGKDILPKPVRPRGVYGRNGACRAEGAQCASLIISSD